MKKLLFTLVISGMYLSGFAQAPTLDFESWSGNNPSGWVSANAIMLLGNPQSVFNETTAANVHGGVSSMKIVTVTLTNNPDPANVPNPMGAAFPGVVNLSPLSLKDGYQYAGRPTTANFWYKYAPVGADSASCFIMLSKWNTTRDTIAVGGWVLKTAATSYAQATINLTYDAAFSTMIPDTMRLYYSATCYATLSCGTAGSTLWVDDIGFSGWNGVNENPNAEGVTLYPNPANEFVNISVDALNEAYSVSAFDATGRIISTAALLSATNGMNRKSGVINTASLPSGLYSYTVNSKEGIAVRSGKFSVVR
jgi:hypothetical protein